MNLRAANKQLEEVQTLWLKEWQALPLLASPAQELLLAQSQLKLPDAGLPVAIGGAACLRFCLPVELLLSRINATAAAQAGPGPGRPPRYE